MEYPSQFPPGPDDEPVYGPLQPPRRRLPRAAIIGGLATALALSGAGIAYASSSSSGGSSPANAAASSPTSTVAPATPKGPGRGHPGFGFKGPGFGFPGLGGRILYGQATIQQPDGTTKTVEFQSGTVSDVSGSSITVNTGSYTHSYKVDSSTVVDAQAAGISTVAKGDQVELLATQKSGSDTAVNIVDITKIKSSRSGFGFGGEKGEVPGDSPPASTPSTGTPATGSTWGSGPGGPGFDSQFGPSQVQ